MYKDLWEVRRGSNSTDSNGTIDKTHFSVQSCRGLEVY